MGVWFVSTVPRLYCERKSGPARVPSLVSILNVPERTCGRAFWTSGSLVIFRRFVHLSVMSKQKPLIKIREANRDDVAELMELNRAAYPVLTGENVVWGESHLLSHKLVFPQGQLVATVDRKI
jgi:hypothetical protein